MLKWAEISTRPDRARFDALAKVLAEHGLENSVDYLQSDEGGFADALRSAQKTYAQLRIGGELRGLAPKVTDHMPSKMLTLKVADAFVLAVGNMWWPQSFLEQGIGRALISDTGNLDMAGAAFLLGATHETRAAVSALAKIGFGRFSIADAHDDRGRSLIEELKSAHFGVQLQFVGREQITQLPSVHSIAVNTLADGEDGGTLRELYYFNFLRTGGVWMDLSARSPSSDLEVEARAVGAVIQPGYRALVWTDVQWARDVLNVKIDPEKLATAYAIAFGVAAAKPV